MYERPATAGRSCTEHSGLRNKTNLGRKVNLTELEPGCRYS